MSIFGFKSKKGEILNHWISFVDGFRLSAQEFYETVQKEIGERGIPGMDMTRVEWAEGGILSNKRTYLRMLRGRLAFDTCAAPFGNIYFFSCRTVFIPPVIKIWEILVLFLVLLQFFGLLFYYLGLLFSLIAFFSLLIALAQTFQNAVILALSDVDAALIKTPVIGPIYEIFFRKETYYREDTRLLYLKVLPELIKELAEDAVAAKGLKLREQYARAPVLGELYRPLSQVEKEMDTPEDAVSPQSSF